MGSPPAPMLANGWMSKFDDQIKGNAVLYSRYMDDILRNIKSSDITTKLNEINSLHPSLKFTLECEKNGSLPFLDMLIQNINGKLVSTWYTKATDTGLTMNFHALAPEKYKRSVVSGMVHRILRACSTWKTVHDSLDKAKKILENNQYPPSFYNPIIQKCLNSVIVDKKEEAESVEEDEKEFKMLFIQYRGRVSEKFEQSLKKLNAPCKVIYTLKKIKTLLPSLKPPVEKSLKSGLVYKIDCPRCNSCYVGMTSRHLLTRFKEHLKSSSPVSKHMTSCNHKVTTEDVTILSAAAKSVSHLLILEALFIYELKPSINTKDEYKSHTLVIKI